MICKHVKFWVTERINTFKPSGTEWALYAVFADKVQYRDSWTIKTWDKRPSEETIQEAVEIIIRSFEFYHRSVRIPSFDVTGEILTTGELS